MMPGSAAGTSKAGSAGWLAFWGVLALGGCSDPYEPEAQFWPIVAGSSTGGGISPDTGGGGGAAGGPSVVPSGGSEPQGTPVNPIGGTPGASGATTQPTGGTASGGSGVSGGGNLGGSTSVGGSASGSAGSSSSAGNPGVGGGTSSSNCSLSVKVTTAPAGGKYAPRNIGAIWVADESGKFVRSLEVWAQKRANHLTQWNSATSKAGAAGSRVDIVSQATLPSHKAHTATWNCQDFKKLPVPDGTYRVYFEMSDNADNGPNRFETFIKGPAAVTSNPADNNNFKSIELSFKP